MFYYQLHGRLRSDVNILNNMLGSESVFGSSAPRPIFGEYFQADWIILEYRQTQFTQMGGAIPYILEYLKQLDPPVYEVSYQGIPLMKLYKQH
jgi:hypothetical protein